MSKLQNERLNQMIENALSYKQEVKKIKSNSLHKRIKDLIPVSYTHLTLPTNREV